MLCPYIWEKEHHCVNAAFCKDECHDAIAFNEMMAEERHEAEEELKLMEMADGCYWDRLDIY